jgi:predicted O-linked N-acetylglucosamine transferase (SPINDLY family)
MMTSPPDARLAEQFARAQLLQQQGQFASARLVYQELLDAMPDHFGALNAMGVLAGQAKDLQQAIRYFEQAIAVEPDNSGAHCNLGLTLKLLHQPGAALACFDRALALDPRSVMAHYSRAETFSDLGRTSEALASYDEAVASNPGFVHAFYRRGLVLQQIGRLDDAIASYDEAIRLNPDLFEAYVNRARSLFALGLPAEALSSCDQAIALKSDQPRTYVLRGNILRSLGRNASALTSYEQAISVNSSDAEAHCNRGAALLLLHRIHEALPSFDRAIAIKPDYAEAYFHRGYSLRMLNRFESAATDFKTVDSLEPKFEFLPGTRLEADMHICDWSNYEELVGRIAAGVESNAHVTHPLIYMALSESARLQHQVARTWCKFACPANDSLGPIAPRARRSRLTVAYFSADFHEHPVSRLLAELIEIHDRSRFEVIAFSFGPRTHDEWQQRLSHAFDKFIDVQEKTNIEIASLARSLNVDIAVDLGGYAFGNRANIFALRAAPVQVSYLGYLGTMGADYIDYIVADRTTVTPESEIHFTEKIIYLPGSHQANDRKRRIGDKVFTRKELGLPSTGFVFCCFNTSYKISPPTFAGWMGILKAVPGSTLLLYAGNETTAINLRDHAARHGIDPHRLVFGERLPPAEYLARYRAADLFLDTLPYNAGATASDALWAGLPVLTLTGEAFASRIAASLLTAMGIPELITSTQQQYEKLAIELASNPTLLAAVRTKIEDNRLTSPLFDTSRFARNLEAAYTAIYDRYQAGLPPDHMRV